MLLIMRFCPLLLVFAIRRNSGREILAAGKPILNHPDRWEYWQIEVFQKQTVSQACKVETGEVTSFRIHIERRHPLEEQALVGRDQWGGKARVHLSGGGAKWERLYRIQ